MAVSQEDILNRIQQVYTEMGNTPEANAQIVRDANQFGVTPEQIAQAANISSSQVRSLAEEAGQPFTPPTAMDAFNALKSGDQTRAQGLLNLSVGLPADTTTTGGMLGGTNIDLTQPTSSSVSLTQPTESPTLDLSSQYEDPFEQAVFDIYRNTTGDLLPVEGVQQFGGMFKEDVQSGMSPEDAASKYVNFAMQSPAYKEKVTEKANELFRKGIEEKDPFALGTMLFNIRESGSKVTPQALEQIFGPEAEGGYDLAGTAGGVLRGLVDVNTLMERGDTEQAQALLEQIQSDPEAYQKSLDADPWADIRWNVLTEDKFYGRSSPRSGGWLEKELSSFGRSVGSFFENPIDALDRWKDRPLNQFIVSAVFGPAAGALLSSYSTLDRGGELSPMQIIALAANAPGIGNLAQQGANAIGVGDLGITDSAALQSVSEGAKLLDQASSIISSPVEFVANNIIGNLGGKEALIAAAGEGAAGLIEEGLRSGATAALIAEATGENPAIAFVKELKGDIPIENFIPDVPESVKNFVAGVGDAISDIPSPDLGFVEDWVKENITLQVNTDLFDGIRGLGFTDKLSSIEDWVKDNVDLSGIEDFLKESGDAIGDTVKEIVEAVPEIDVPEIDLPSMDLPDLSIPGVVPMQELAGSGFTPQRGYQPGLAVDLDFDLAGRSAVLDILNQPSSVRRA